MHAEAVTKLAALNSATLKGIDVQFSAQLAHDQKHHRLMLMKVLTTLKFLTRQGLPLRGHNESSESFEGNLYQLLLLQAEDCPGMESWLKHREYNFPEIINELITEIGHSLLCKLLED